MNKFINICMAVLVTLALGACNKGKNHPGYTFYPDMAYTPAAKTYTESKVFKDGLTMQLPADGSIPRGYTPYPYKAKSFQDQQNAGIELKNPIEVNPQVLAEGKKQYEIYCLSCHGTLGKGDGHLYTSKLFPAKPTSLVEPFVQGKSDGEIYHVITMGSLSGLMGSHASQILPENRWKIIHYVRSLTK